MDADADKRRGELHDIIERGREADGADGTAAQHDAAEKRLDALSDAELLALPGENDLATIDALLA